MDVITGVEGTTLIMPSPGSIGFLGSLSIDIIINSFNLKRIAELNIFQLEQLIGTKVFNIDEDNEVVHSAVELYQGSLLPNMSVLQIRTNPIAGYAVSFSKSISSWISNCKFQRVVMLTGLDQCRREDAQLLSSPLRYYANFELDSHASLLEGIKQTKIIRMEDLLPSHQYFPVVLPPGSGCGQFILNCLKKENMECFVLSYFTEVGDNNHAAHLLAETAVRILNIESSKALTSPLSWKRLVGNALTTQEILEIF